MMNFSLWMAKAFAHSQQMTQLMMWPYAALLLRKQKPETASRA